MEDSGAILCQISVFKDMLDQEKVNLEIDVNIQVTREIESEIGECTDMESTLSLKEAELTRSFLASQFEISGLISVTEAGEENWTTTNHETVACDKKTEKPRTFPVPLEGTDDLI